MNTKNPDLKRNGTPESGTKTAQTRNSQSDGEERHGSALDASEKERKERAQRLRTARKEYYGTATRAAASLRIAISTYSNHENGNRDIGDSYIKCYAQKFGLNEAWLKDGDGEQKSENGPDHDHIYSRNQAVRHTNRNPLIEYFDVYRSKAGYDVNEESALGATMLPLYSQSDRNIAVLKLADSADLSDGARDPNNTKGAMGPRRVTLHGSSDFELADFIVSPFPLDGTRRYAAIALSEAGFLNENDVLVFDTGERNPLTGGLFVVRRNDVTTMIHVKQERGFDEPEHISYRYADDSEDRTMKLNKFKSIVLGRYIFLIGFWEASIINKMQQK